MGQKSCPIGCGDSQGWVGGPINTSSGNYNYQQEDISLAALGGPIRFERSYNSRGVDFYTQTLGYGWTHNYDTILLPGSGTDSSGIREPGTVIIQWGSGSRFRFIDNADDGITGTDYIPFPGVWATLTHTKTQDTGVISYFLQMGDQSLYVYTATDKNSPGRLVEMWDAQKHPLVFTYEGDKLERVADATGERSLDFDYDEAGYLRQVRDPLDRTVSFGYENGNLTVVTDTRGNPWTYTYTGTHWLYEVLDPLEKLVERTNYDAGGRAIEQWTAASETPLRIEYGTDRTVTTTNPLEQVRIDRYESRNVLESQTGVAAPLSQTHDFGFNPDTSTDANGYTTRVRYNSMGLPEAITDANNGTIQVAYDAQFHPIVVTDALKNRTSYQYENNRLKAITDSLGGTLCYSYDPNGFLTQTVDHGLTTTYSYYSTGERKALTDTNGVTTYEYDAIGRLITTTLPGNRIMVNGYDHGNFLITSTQNYTSAGGRNYLDKYNLITRYEYDAVGRQIAVTDTLDRVSRWGYDDAGRMVSTTINFSAALHPSHGPDNAWNLTTLYEYDELNRQIAVTGTDGRVSRSYYDDIGQLVSTTVEAGENGEWKNTTNYGYDPAGNLTLQTNTWGYATRYQYNSLNQIVEQVVNYSKNTYQHGPHNDRNITTTYGYDKLGNQVAVTDSLGRVTLSEYNALNQLITRTINPSAVPGHGADNTQNLTTTYGYDKSGHQIALTDTLNGVIRRFYNTAGRLISETRFYSPSIYPNHGLYNDWNLTTWYGYDDLGRQIAVTNPLGMVNRSWYDDAGRLISTTTNYSPALPLNSGQWNLVTRYEYDVLGNQTRVTDSLDRVTFTEYDALNRPVTVTTNYQDGIFDPAHPDEDLIRVTVYDSAGQIAQLKDPARRITYYEYDFAGHPMTVTKNYVDGVFDPAHPDEDIKTVTVYDDLGRVTQRIEIADTEIETDYYYDTLSRLFRTSDPISGLTSNYYDVLGRVISSVDVEGKSTLHSYDAAGRLVTTTQELPDTHELTRTTLAYYDPLGRVTARMAGNYTTTYRYDGAGRLITLTNPLTQSTYYAYDLLGRRTVMTDADGVAVHSIYNNLGQLIATRDALSHTTAYAYDSMGNRTWVTNAAGTVTRYEYDALGKLVTVTENFAPELAADHQTNVRTVYGYDVSGNLITITDALAHTTVYTYDKLGRLIASADPLGNETRYEYDGHGRRVNAVYPDAGGAITVATEYNAMGWPLQIVYPAVGEVPGFTATLAYNGLGRREVITDATGVITYNYDALYQPVGIEAPAGAVHYEYDDLGRRKNLIYPTGEVVTYTHDGANRLVRVEWISDSIAMTTLYTYTAAGRLSEIRLPNGVTTRYEYDPAGRLVKLEHQRDGTLIGRYEYELDALGNRRTVTETLQMGESAALPEFSPLGLAAAPVLPEAPGAARNPVPPDLSGLLMTPLLIAAVLGRGRRTQRWAAPIAALFLVISLLSAGTALASAPEVPGAASNAGALIRDNRGAPAIPEIAVNSDEETPTPEAATPTPEALPIEPTIEAPVPPLTDTHPVSTSEVVPSDWLTQIQTGVQQSEYRIGRLARNRRGLYQAPNRAHNLRTYFTTTGILVTPRRTSGADWTLGLNLTGYGYRNALQPVLPITPSTNANRADYRRESRLAEWYFNDERGLEQGFTLSAPPAGTRGTELVLELALSGTLTPVLSGEHIEFLDAAGKIVAHYSGLEAFDATQQVLPSHLELEGTTVRLVVDDTGAVYPVTIDPLLSSPAWIVESNQAAAEFGVSAGTAGDVNGDGYADVLVGSCYYDDGEANEGRVFLYYGSASGLSTTPAWTTESNQAGAELGRSVGTAGDVNGDGYADILVGSTKYDHGQTDEGIVRAYYGSANGLSSVADWEMENNIIVSSFGSSVSGAGDVNGDGYGDVLIGASTYSNGQNNEGASYLYYGSAEGLGTSAAWSVESDQAGANFGSPVAPAGDVNGDGYGDIIVGAEAYDNGTYMDAGKAYVYYGSASGLNGTADWTLTPNQTNARMGRSAAGAGDVNGDGYADVIVGGYNYDSGQTDEGIVYVYHGSAAGLSTTAAWTGEGNQASAAYGTSANPAGDVNGDGYADIIVGAIFYDNGQGDEGQVYVYYGSANGLNSAADWTAESDQASALFGWVSSPAGDVNGDGYADVLIGSVLYDNGQTNEGRAYVYHGAPSGLLSATPWSVSGGAAGNQLGYAAGSAGDVNGDGYADVIVGMPYYDDQGVDQGRAYVYPGTATGIAATAIWTGTTGGAAAHYGAAVSAAGDVNGDGYADIIVGAPQADSPGLTDDGRAFVYYGTAAGVQATAAITLAGGQNGAHFGAAVAAAGDVNGDGYADVTIGAPDYDVTQGATFADSGRVFVYYGSPTGLHSPADWFSDVYQSGAHIGRAVGTAGDVNRDGYADLAIGAPDYDDRNPNSGMAFVYHGAAGGVNSTPAWTATLDPADAHFGAAVGTAGDVNGDGYSDLVVGAPDHRSGTYTGSEGQVDVYYGSATGLSATPDWRADGEQEGARFGSSVATAGDPNGDGYADIAVGASLYNNSGASAGKVYLYQGGASGANSESAWTAVGQPGDMLGSAVGTAGDGNGDGYADLVVGVKGNGSSAGATYVYYGNERKGVSLNPHLRLSNDRGPLAQGGKADRWSLVALAVQARSPFGRGKVKLEWEVAPLGTPFTASAGVIRGISKDWTDSLAAGVNITPNITGLSESTAYHWRVRVHYHPAGTPFQQYSRWITQPWNGVQEQDFRTAADSGPVTRVIDYTYDPLGRLTAADYSTGQHFGYQYDAVGNRTAMTDTTGTHTYTYNAANRLTSADGVSYTWDGRGNLVNDGTFTYTYDSAGRMVKTESATATTVYTYNADGLRIAQRVGTQETTFIWDTTQPLAQVLSTSDGARDFYGVGRIAERQNGIWSYPLGDALGSVRQWVDAGGVVRYSATYEPYGEVLESAGTAPSPWGFTGEWQDSQTEMLYLRARWYQPETGRFTQVDPWEGDRTQPQSLNDWAYVEGNPAKYIDPMGLKGIVPWGLYYNFIGRKTSVEDADIINDLGNQDSTMAEMAMKKIEQNFQGNPEYKDKQLSREMLLLKFNEFGCELEGVFSFHRYIQSGGGGMRPDDVVHYKTQDIYVGERDYDRYDWLISGWVDYWNWRVLLSGNGRDYQLDPNFVKAILYVERTMGYADESNGKYQGLMQLGPEAWEDLKKVESGRLFWGPINITNRQDPSQNIAGGVRWLMHKYGLLISEGETPTWFKAYARYSGFSLEDNRMKQTQCLYETGLDPEYYPPGAENSREGLEGKPDFYIFGPQ